jgi:hypothetical protein
MANSTRRKNRTLMSKKPFSKNVKVLEYEEQPETSKETVKPMLNAVPTWYKEIPREVMTVMGEHPSVKHCIPFLDALTVGYYIGLGQDVYIEQTDNGPSARYSGNTTPVNNRPPGATGKMPAPEGYDEEHLIWVTQAAVKIPEGYSAIYTHPLNRFDLPFITLSGVADGEFVVHGGNVPFHIKKGFEGLIPKGTPIIQIIPFLREDWKSKRVEGTWEKGLQNTSTEDYGLGSWYRRRKWQKKSYK